MTLSIGAALMAYDGVRSDGLRAAQVEHTHDVLLQIEQVNATLQELLLNARGYAASRQQAPLLAYERDRIALFQTLDTLRATQRDNPELLVRLTQLSETIGKRVEIVHLRMDAAQGVLDEQTEQQARALSDDIRQQLGVLRDSTRRQLDAALAERKRGMQWGVLAILFDSILSGVILVAAYLSLNREILSNAEAQTQAKLTLIESDALYNLAPCGYHSVREDSLLITRINDTALAWLGYTREQVVGKISLSELLTPESVTQYQREIRPALLSGKTVNDVLLEYRRADGQILSVRLSASLGILPDSRDLIAHYVLNDVTEQRRAIQDIDQLTQHLRRNAQQLSNVNKELESFSYSVSHDLRAPLRAISGYALMIEEDYSEALGSKGQELLQVISKNVKKMDGLISDLLKLSKSTTTDLTHSQFSMQALVQVRIAAFQQRYDQVEFIVSPLDDAPAHEGLLAQVWDNLLDNAIKFSARSASPQVRISSQASEQEVIYEVSDNGVGFDMRYVHKLFGSFQRLHRQEEFPGSGIGLAQVQRIVMRHGGRVWAHSEPGEGARFYFALPRTTL